MGGSLFDSAFGRFVGTLVRAEPRQGRVTPPQIQPGPWGFNRGIMPRQGSTTSLTGTTHPVLLWVTGHRGRVTRPRCAAGLGARWLWAPWRGRAAGRRRRTGRAGDLG